MLKLDITNNAAKFLKKLSPKQFKQVMATVLSLMKEPEPHDSIQMKGYAQYRRTDIGEYRIVYRYTEIFLFVVEIGKRNDGEVYKRFKAKSP